MSKNQIEDRKYIRPMDVVRMSGLSKSTVMAAIWGKELEAFRMGRAWLVPVEAVDKWIRSGSSEEAGPFLQGNNIAVSSVECPVCDEINVHLMRVWTTTAKNADPNHSQHTDLDVELGFEGECGHAFSVTVHTKTGTSRINVVSRGNTTHWGAASFADEAGEA